MIPFLSLYDILLCGAALLVLALVGVGLMLVARRGHQATLEASAPHAVSARTEPEAAERASVALSA